MAADPGRRLSEVSLLRDAERAQVLEAWNDTAARAPHAPACTSSSPSRRRAPPHAVARRLRGRGAHLRGAGAALEPLAAPPPAAAASGPEVRVGICLDRGARDGGRCAGRAQGRRRLRAAGPRLSPRAPGLPARRLPACSLLRHRDRAARAAPGLRGRGRLPGHASGTRSPAEPDEAPGSGRRPAQPAYVIYTSGSTGTAQGRGGRAPRSGQLRQPVRDTLRARAGSDVVLGAGELLLRHLGRFEVFVPLRQARAVRLLPRSRSATRGAGARRCAGGRASPARRARADAPSWSQRSARRRRAPARECAASRGRRGRAARAGGGDAARRVPAAELRVNCTGRRRRRRVLRGRAHAVPAATRWTDRSGDPLGNVRLYVLRCERGSRCRSACAGELCIGGRGRGARLPGPAGA